MELVWRLEPKVIRKMATSRALLCMRWTSKVFTSRCLPFKELNISLVNLRAFGVMSSGHRLFRTVRSDTVEQLKTDVESSNSEPRNLLEVYENKPAFLRGPRNAIKPLTEEDVAKEIRRSRRLRLRTPVRINPQRVGWTTGSKRVGTIGVKLGMSALWLKDGRRIPVTLIQIKDCQVIQARIGKQHGGKDHKTELQVGAVDETKIYKVRKAQFGHFRRHGVQPKKKMCSFPVTRNALLHPGTPLYAAHYYPGQFINIQGITKDRGFQGVMKRWKMKGGPASHGVSKTHRKMGATGGGQDPGRIWPGKRMAGHMGGKKCTKFAVKILRINTKYNVLYIHGECPGEKGGYIVMSDAWKKHERPPPFPTYFPDPNNQIEEDMYDESIQHTDQTITFRKTTKTR